MNSSSKQKVLVAIPAWNEENTIADVLREIKVLYPDFDVLVVNDGSDDATASIAEEVGAKVVSHNGNLGYTAAIQTGRVCALEGGYDFLVFIDADGQHRVSDIGRILDPLIRGDADQVRGSRELGKYEWKEPLHLKIPRWICSMLVSLRLRKVVTDATSGFKGENRAITLCFKQIYEASKKLHLSNTNDIEEHLLAHKKGFRLMEVPTTMRRRSSGETKCYTPKELLTFPVDLICTFLRDLQS
jgi:glycosyltransferase involved in cell wall biosynthesis